MRGQFLFSTCKRAGLEVSALLRNSLRRSNDIPEDTRRRGMSIDLKVFEQGRRVFHNPNFATLGVGEVCRLARDNCAALDVSRSAHDRLIVAECYFDNDATTAFPQEHQIIYSNPKTGFFSSLLYDQRPVPRSHQAFSPIVLMAPKVWVGADINTLVSFSSFSPADSEKIETVPLDVTILSPGGETLAQIKHNKVANSAWILDLGEVLREQLLSARVPRFLTVAARGGAAAYAIMTFVVNRHSGTFALEHSLPPNYYMDGDPRRVRSEAARFV